MNEADDGLEEMPAKVPAGVPADVILGRRDRVLDALAGDAMVLPAGPVLHRSGDSELPYRPDSELYYLTGLKEPEVVLVLRGFADEQRTVLFVRSRSRDAELWTGPRMGPEGASELPGVDEAHPVEELPRRLPELLDGAGRVYFRLGCRPQVERAVVSALQHARARGARKGKGPRGAIDPGEILDEMRLRKGPEEIRAIRHACRVTTLGFQEALGAVRPGAGEWQVEAAIEHAFRREGAEGPAFATIVGSGTNACVLHYISNSRTMESGDLVLVDAGAEVGLYSGDVTRTVPVTGRFSPRQRDVYDLVEAARTAAVERIRPGATVADVHDAATRTLVQGLVELEVLSGDVDELIEEGDYRRFFPHRTSHWLGLDTHDPGDYMRDGESRVLESGMVLTVEPGLYFRPPENGEEGDEDPDRAAPFRGVGIRIEDDVLVTESGAEVLTAHLPTEPDRVAGLVGG